MRTSFFTAVVGLSLVGCLVGDPGTPGEGGDDDGTGDGSQNGSGSNNNPTPRLDVSMDKAKVSTELGKQEVVTLTFTSVDGFAGDVAVATSLADAAGAAITGGITVTGQPSVSIAANGTATAMYTLKVPSNATGADLAGNLKFDINSAVGAKQLTSPVSISAVYTVTYAAGLAGNQANHPERGQTISVKKGAKIRYRNADTVVHITHGDGAFPHETTGATGGLANNTYEVTTANAAVGATGNLGCHSHGSATYAKFAVE